MPTGTRAGYKAGHRAAHTAGPPKSPLGPVLRQMALGLGVTVLGATVAWRSVELRPTPGLESISTPITVPLDGPLPLDLAQEASLRFEGNRTALELAPLPPGSPQLLQGTANHRSRNPLTLQVRRQGRQVSVTAQLYVASLYSEGSRITPAPEPVQHSLRAALSPNLPLSLSTYTVGGPQNLDLAGLRIRTLTARSDSGDLMLGLPARAAGPYAIVTRSGAVTVEAGAGSSSEALRVNSQAGDLQLNLRGSALDILNAGTQSGAIALRFPARLGRGSLTTDSGNITVQLGAGARGNLDIRTLSGRVTVRVPASLRLRVRFTDSATITRPAGAAQSPQLDLFVDGNRQNFTLQTEE